MATKPRARTPKREVVGEIDPATTVPVVVASQASRYADDARRQRQARGVETPLMYARRMAGWPPLREKDA